MPYVLTLASFFFNQQHYSGTFCNFSLKYPVLLNPSANKVALFLHM